MAIAGLLVIWSPAAGGHWYGIHHEAVLALAAMGLVLTICLCAILCE